MATPVLQAHSAQVRLGAASAVLGALLALVVNPARPEIWYVSAAPGPSWAHGDGDARAHVFRSVDGGPCRKLGGGLPQPLGRMPYALVTDPTAPGQLYAGLADGDVWHSTDHGDSWVRLPLSLGRIRWSMLLL